MRVVPALSIDAALPKPRGAAHGVGRIHSVFERAINIDAGGGRLVTLAHRESDIAPDTVVVDLDRCSDLELAPGVEARFSARRILLGDVVVVLESARRWHGSLPAYAPDRSRLRVNLSLAQDHLVLHGHGIGMRKSRSAASPALARAVGEAFLRCVHGLEEALAHDDEAQAREHVARMVGLGPGLTPAGDDYLVGLLTALNIPGSPRRAWRRIGNHVVECAGQKTHLISATALRHAATGRARACLIGFCDALMHQPSTPMLKALARVIGIGSSSGTAIALGLLAGFQLHLGTEAKWPLPPTRRGAFGDAHGG